MNGALKAFAHLGANVSDVELRRWTSAQGRRKLFEFTDFVLAFANILYPSDPTKDSTKRATDAIGRSLRLGGDWKSLTGFAQSFGTSKLKDLERAFDRFSTKDVDGNAKMQAADIISCFHSMGRAITVTRLQEWMMDADVKPQDFLSLADLASVFAFFFHSSSHEIMRDNGPGGAASMTLAEIAVQILQEERWRGTQDQKVAFLRRLCAGRSESLVSLICKLRDAFEKVRNVDFNIFILWRVVVDDDFVVLMFCSVRG